MTNLRVWIRAERCQTGAGEVSIEDDPQDSGDLDLWEGTFKELQEHAEMTIAMAGTNADGAYRRKAARNVLREIGGLVYVTADPENNADNWWDAAREAEDVPTRFRPLLDFEDGVEVTRKEARDIFTWGATLPGWDTGDERAPCPLVLGEA